MTLIPELPPEISTVPHIDVLKLRIAARVAPLRWSKAMEQLGDNIQAGRSWEEAVADPLWRPRLEVRALVEAALQSGQPADTTLRLLQSHAQTMSTWRGLVAALSYPLFLLAVTVPVASITGVLMMSVLAESPGWNIDTNSIDLLVRDFHDMAIGIAISALWLVLIFATIRLAATPTARLKIISSLPVIGRPYRWLALSDMLARLTVISYAQPSLSDALRTTGHSYGNSALRSVAQRVAQRVDQGVSLKHAVHQTLLSDDRAGVALTLIDMDQADFSQSVGRASQLLEQMASHTCEQLKVILPMFVLLLLASLIWSAWACYVTVFTLLTNVLM